MPLIKIEIHRHYHYFDRQEFQNMSRQLDALVEEVAALRGVTDSAVALIGSLADQIEHLQNDPAALQALADDLRAQRTNLATAVLLNDGDPTNDPTPPGDGGEGGEGGEGTGGEGQP